MSIENRLSALDILTSFFDDGSFNETDSYLKGDSDFAEAVTGYGEVDGMPVYAFAQNVDICGGAMSKAQAEKIKKLYSLALKTGTPIVGFYNSNGGRIDQKYELLAAYGDILKSASSLSGVVPQISVVLGTCLGTSAITAASADFIIMNKDAVFSVDTVGADNDAQFNAKHGLANFVCDSDEECIQKAKTLLSYFPANNLDSAPVFESLDAKADDCIASYIADEGSILSVNKDFGDACTAFGRVGGVPVGFINTNGKEIDCKSAKKICKMVRFCDAFSIPVITFADSASFKSVNAAVKVTSAYTEATTAKISLITGQAVGVVYIALASTSSDFVYALNDAVVSPVSPKAAAFILDDNIANLPVEQQEEYAQKFIKENLTAQKAAEDGYVDDIIYDYSEARAKILAALNILSTKRISTLPKKHSTIN